MIESADEFCRLRTSEKREEYEQASRDDAPVEVWRDVIARYPGMRYWVAVNKTVPIEILWLLSDDPDPRVRQGVARRRKLDIHLFRKLARDPDGRIRGEIAYNKKVTIEVLEFLTEDVHEWVRDVACEKLEERKQRPGDETRRFGPAC